MLDYFLHTLSSEGQHAQLKNVYNAIISGSSLNRSDFQLMSCRCFLKLFFTLKAEENVLFIFISFPVAK